MAQVPKIAIEVQGERIIATLPGTDFATSYHRTANGISQDPGMLGRDGCGSISRDEFETAAWEAAMKKAQELGWVS